MKKLFTLILIATLFISCSSDDDNNGQDYTSFQIIYNFNVEVMANTVIGYKVGNEYKKLATLGDLKKGVWSKEITIEGSSIKEIYIFSDYPYPSIRTDIVFTIKQNINNRFEIPSGVKGIEVTDITDPTQYPQ